MKEFFKINSLAFIIKIIGALFSMLTISMLTRILSKEEFAKYVLFNSSINIITVIFFQWISVIVSRYLTLNQSFILDYTRNKFKITSSILIFLSIILSIYFKNYNIFFIILTSVSFGFYNIILQITNSLENWRIYNILLLTKYIITFFFLSILVYLTRNSISILISIFLGSLFSILYFQRKNQIIDQTNIKINDNLFYFGFTYTIILMSTSILDFADRYLLKYLKGDFQLSQYAANYDLIQQSVGGVLGIFAIFFMPKIVSYKNLGKLDSFFFVNNFFLNFTIIFGTLISFNFYIAYPIISKVIAEKYRYITNAEVILIILGIYISILKGTIFDLNLQIEGKNKILILNIVFMTLMNIIFNIILIPKYSQLGSAFSTFISFFIGLIISVFYSIKYFKINQRFYLDLLKFSSFLIIVIFLNKLIVSNYYLFILSKNIFFTVLLFIILYYFNLFDTRLYIYKAKTKLFEF